MTCRWCELNDCPKHAPTPGIGAFGAKAVEAREAQAMVDQIFKKEKA